MPRRSVNWRKEGSWRNSSDDNIFTARYLAGSRRRSSSPKIDPVTRRQIESNRIARATRRTSAQSSVRRGSSSRVVSSRKQAQDIEINTLINKIHSLAPHMNLKSQKKLIDTFGSREEVIKELKNILKDLRDLKL